jgi:capsular polysaccharide biosynthesis protein
MIPTSWGAADFDDDDPSVPGRPLPTLVSLHFLRYVLRRRWVACVMSAMLGLAVATALLVAVPPPHEAKAVLLLAHDPKVESSEAMSTDVSLLTTRTVAAKTIARLGLTITPDEFLSSMTAESVSTDVMSVTLTAPTDAEAVRRLGALTSTYLDFRAEQLSVQSNVLVDGMKQRITKLKNQVGDLTQRIDRLSASGSSAGASELGDAISQRAQVTRQIDTLQQSVQDATLSNASIVSSSRVIDPAAVKAGGVNRRIVLTLASGLIGGAVLGCGAVLVLAITSDRLRRRFDVATALEVPVPISTRRITPLRRGWRRLPYLRGLEARRADGCRRLAYAIEMGLPLPGRLGRLAVACIENADEVRFAVATAATNLAFRGSKVLLIDLTEHGSLHTAVEGLMPGETVDRPTVLRPRGIPALARDHTDLRVVGSEDDDGAAPSPDLMDVCLVLADLDPSVGADHLVAWTHRVVVVVTAGLSSAERVRTAAELVRAAGLDLRFGALLRADAHDESSGEAGRGRPAAVDIPEVVHGPVEPETRESEAQ